MRIGILTFHRAHNYGAVLQCYALQEVLRGMGHEVEVIDYRQKKIEDVYRVWRFKHFKFVITDFSELFQYIGNYHTRKNKRKIFSEFRKKYLFLSRPCSQSDIPVDYDIYVIGSDQLWSLSCVGYNCKKGAEDTVFMGDFNHAKSSKLIGYAISSNVDSINEISNKLNHYVDNFHALSFREQVIMQKVIELTGKNCSLCVDPTILLPSSLWEKMILNKRKLLEDDYVLFYEARKSTGDILRNKCKELCYYNNLHFLDMSNMQYDVLEFISAFKYASCVITSSFHATVFSIIFERPLIAVKLNDGHDGRIINLLNQVGANNALFDVNFGKHIPSNFDYSVIRGNIEKMRIPSLEFLKKNL